MMKIVCDRDSFLAAFQLAGSVAPPRSPHEVLQSVKVVAEGSRVTLMGSDMEASIRVDLEGAEAESPGSSLLHVTRAGMILRESGDEKLTIQTDGNRVTIIGERSEFNLSTPDPSTFPTIESFDENAYHELPAQLLRILIRRTVFAADPASSRFALGGMLLELNGDDVLAVGTDGRRLAHMAGMGLSVNSHSTSDGSTIIPVRALQVIERSIGDSEEPVKVASRSTDIMIKTSRCTVRSRLVEGRYPNWRQVIPKRDDSHKIELTVGPFYQCIRQAAIMADQESRGLDFHFKQGKLLLTSSSADVGKSRVEVAIDYSGDPFKMRLDHRFVADFLKVMEQNAKFVMDVVSTNQPAVLITEDGYQYVLMPMAIDA